MRAPTNKIVSEVNMSIFYRFVRFFVWLPVKGLIRFRAKGRENIPKSGGFVLCCNHTSIIDIAILVLTCPRGINFMAKEELFKNPLLGWFFRRMGAFPIVRGSGDSAAIDKAIDIVKRGDVLGIFPEGTRTKELDGHPCKAKAGAAMIAAATGAPVLPSAIHYDKYDGKVHLFKRSYVRYGELISSSELNIENNDRKQIRAATERIMGSITALWEEETDWKSN